MLGVVALTITEIAISFYSFFSMSKMYCSPTLTGFDGILYKTLEDGTKVANAGETKLMAVAGEYRDEGMIRKVDTMNPDYILREQGAVLNWFDITEIEGRFSLNDKLGDVFATLRGKLWFAGLFMTLARKMSANKPKDDGKKSNNSPH